MGGFSRPISRGKVGGSGQGGLQAHTQGEGGGLTGGGSPGPGPGGAPDSGVGEGVGIPACTEADPPADGYCCGRYASYWNAFSFKFNFFKTYSSTRALHFMFLTLCFYLSAILEFTPSPTSPPTTLPPTLVPPQCSSWSPQTCRNGGSIVVVNGQCGCQCTSGWTGLYCDGKLFLQQNKNANKFPQISIKFLFNISLHGVNLRCSFCHTRTFHTTTTVRSGWLAVLVVPERRYHHLLA